MCNINYNHYNQVILLTKIWSITLIKTLRVKNKKITVIKD